MVKISVQDLRVYFNDPGVEKSAKTLIKAVDGIFVEFNEGERVAIIGKNGAGKSTLLSVLAGVKKPDSGQVIIEGECLSLINRTSGLLPNATLYENAKLKAYSLGLKKKAVEEYTQKVIQYAGLNNRKNSSLKSLSKGMVARFNISLHSQIIKPIMILDEWIGALDVSESGGNDVLNRIVEETQLVVLASHNQKLIRQLCNRFVLVDQGEILVDSINADDAFRELAKIK